MPDAYQKFDENLIVLNKKEKTFCPVCEKEKQSYNKTCSLNCASKLSRKVDWDSVDLKKMLDKYKWNYTHVGDCLDITGSSVKKRAKKLGLV